MVLLFVFLFGFQLMFGTACQSLNRSAWFLVCFPLFAEDAFCFALLCFALLTVIDGAEMVMVLMMICL